MCVYSKSQKSKPLLISAVRIGQDERFFTTYKKFTYNQGISNRRTQSALSLMIAAGGGVVKTASQRRRVSWTLQRRRRMWRPHELRRFLCLLQSEYLQYDTEQSSMHARVSTVSNTSVEWSRCQTQAAWWARCQTQTWSAQTDESDHQQIRRKRKEKKTLLKSPTEERLVNNSVIRKRKRGPLG